MDSLPVEIFTKILELLNGEDLTRFKRLSKRFSKVLETQKTRLVYQRPIVSILLKDKSMFVLHKGYQYSMTFDNQSFSLYPCIFFLPMWRHSPTQDGRFPCSQLARLLSWLFSKVHVDIFQMECEPFTALSIRIRLNDILAESGCCIRKISLPAKAWLHLSKQSDVYSLGNGSTILEIESIAIVLCDHICILNRFLSVFPAVVAHLSSNDMYHVFYFIAKENSLIRKDSLTIVLDTKDIPEYKAIGSVANGHLFDIKRIQEMGVEVCSLMEEVSWAEFFLLDERKNEKEELTMTSPYGEELKIHIRKSENYATITME